MFKVLKSSKKSKARLGRIRTVHGAVETPFFMPVATFGVVKTLSSQEMENLGYRIILSNTYHLFLRPGLEIIKKFGGLHRFINWPASILTDSGGFQVFSLSKLRKISSKGVSFRSEIDGKGVFLSPKKAIDIQIALGSDILMVLDECIGYPASCGKAQKAVERTTLWARKSKDYFEKLKIKQKPLLFGIVQGSVYPGLRLKSLKEISEIGFDGYAIGGLFVNEPEEKSFEMIELVESGLPQNRPRYILGAAYPYQIIRAIKMGIDMFDCVIPTREARHGRIYRFKSQNPKFKSQNFYEILLITKSEFKREKKPIDSRCNCFTCRNYSIGYLHHLFKVKEPLGQRLATIHNLAFYSQLVKKIKKGIADNQI